MSFPPAPNDDPSPDPTGINPFAAPQAELGEAPPLLDTDLARAEAIRREHISHETSIKSIGTLHLLGAFFTLIGLVGAAFAIVSLLQGPGSAGLSLTGAAMLVYFAVVSILLIAVGLGLRKLRPWARWVDSGLLTLSMLSNLASVGLSVVTDPGRLGQAIAIFAGSSLIPGYMLYLLLSAKGTVVFSREYQEIIARTPHVKMKTSCIVKAFLIFLVVVILMAVGSALIFGLRR
ncbi:MAG: hypothetical protein U0794_09005 [Isosphaeraceae bacterium]